MTQLDVWLCKAQRAAFYVYVGLVVGSVTWTMVLMGRRRG